MGNPAGPLLRISLSACCNLSSCHERGYLYAGVLCSDDWHQLWKALVGTWMEVCGFHSASICMGMHVQPWTHACARRPANHSSAKAPWDSQCAACKDMCQERCLVQIFLAQSSFIRL